MHEVGFAIEQEEVGEFKGVTLKIAKHKPPGQSLPPCYASRSCVLQCARI